MQTLSSNITDASPRILALDTSQPVLHLAVVRGQEVLADIADTSGVSHSQRLFPLLQETLARLTLTVAQLDAFAVNTGPGSFTGLRVGMAAVKGLASTLHKPLFGINALDAAAVAAGVEGVPLIVLLNASRGEVFCGVRELMAEDSVRALGADQVAPFEMILPSLQQRFGSAVVFLGSGAAAHWPAIAAQNPVWEQRVLPDSLAPSLAKYAAAQWGSGQAASASAHYLRLSEAEAEIKYLQ